MKLLAAALAALAFLASSSAYAEAIEDVDAFVEELPARIELASFAAERCRSALRSNGDPSSKHCIDLLDKQADVVIMMRNAIIFSEERPGVLDSRFDQDTVMRMDMQRREIDRVVNMIMID
ncbi:hypothetical protein [Vreelandella aquamarina]|uniref:UrcA family protein n=1 Tax=Vreelandella aquamarina TaxID=77097 RepID=A0A857GSG6_9GAMM|nr:hypothetical protein [Halomonas meridiana]QHD50061.1 hypothetical protein CTT34_10350 [Halomonas meridiana]